MTLKINSAFTILDGQLRTRTVADIKNEPMLFNCDHDAAADKGGALTNEFLHLLPADWQQSPLIIDSRSHMLMPGWYPCIPGWHHDDVPRTRADGQPNYAMGQMRAEHVMALVSSNDEPFCQTEFALGDAAFVEPPQGTVLYEQWHKDVELLLTNNVLQRVEAPLRRLIKFDDRTWHRGTAAKANGWRWFIRATRYRDQHGRVITRPTPSANEIRAQSQIYMSATNAGW